MIRSFFPFPGHKKVLRFTVWKTEIFWLTEQSLEKFGFHFINYPKIPLYRKNFQIISFPKVKKNSRKIIKLSSAVFYGPPFSFFVHHTNSFRPSQSKVLQSDLGFNHLKWIYSILCFLLLLHI